MPSHQVRDQARIISFDGELLAHISSRRADAPRWTEMSLYKTYGTADKEGSFVLEKVGRSIATHLPGCPKLENGTYPRFQDAHPGEDPDDYDYHSCVPDEYDFTQLLVESDRYWATVAEDPVAIVDALYRKKNGVKTMPRISLDLLDMAGKVNASLKQAYMLEHID